MLDLRLEEAGSLASALREGERIVVSEVGHDGHALALAVPEGEVEAVYARGVTPGGSSFPMTRTKHPYAAAVLRLAADGLDRIELELEVAYPRVQPLRGGELLVAGLRCYPGELNACVFGPDGLERRRFVLGDGIRHVQATARGEIWVSYTGEGVFGNYGWGRGENPRPIGGAGLNRFAADGALDWSYKRPEGLEGIVHCYALNVAADAVWAYYFDGFPLVRIGPDDDLAWWPSPVDGASAIAVGDGVAAFHGRYKDDDGLFACALGADGLGEPARSRLVLPSGDAIGRGRAFGHGPFFHFFDGPDWYRADVRSVANAG